MRLMRISHRLKTREVRARRMSLIRRNVRAARRPESAEVPSPSPTTSKTEVAMEKKSRRNQREKT